MEDAEGAGVRDGHQPLARVRDLAAAGRRRRWRAGGHTEVVLLDGIGRRRNAHNKRPKRWFPRLGRVPFRQCERNRAHSDQQKQVKQASNKMRFDREADVRVHLACAPVRKHLLLQAPQSGQDFSAALQMHFHMTYSFLPNVGAGDVPRITVYVRQCFRYTAS